MATSEQTTTPDAPRREPLSAEALETSRLLLEFLHAAYAARRTPNDESAGQPGNGQEASGAASHDEAAGGLSNHAIRAAIHVYQHGERTVGQLASGLGISYGWASRVVDELEAAHYVTRDRDPEDRRIVRVRLDPDALERVERAYRWHGDAVEGALRPLSENERAAVRSFLRHVIDGLRAGMPEKP